MDKKTHETFNEPKNPFINFKMSEVKSITTNGSEISVTIGGTLAMAGTSKTVTLEANGKEIKPGTYTFEGSLPLKMSDYNMKAPTAMLGVMKVGDQVTVKYNVTFEGPAVQFN
jgi:polyisoprenoid-binding protein YceI